MGKKNSTTKIEVTGINKDHLYINESKMRTLSKDMQKQLGILSESLSNIHVSLNKLVNHKVVKGSRLDKFRGLSKKAKAQSIAADKLMNTLTDKCSEDLQLYPIQLLDERIAELEKKIASLTNE